MPLVQSVSAGYQTPQSVNDAIANASRNTGVDFNYLLNQARLESALDPNAKASTSSATGLFQFLDQTWLSTVKTHGGDHGLDWAAQAISRGAKGSYYVSDPSMQSAIMDLRTDPNAASAMAAELAADNSVYLSDTLGRNPEPVDLYIAHFLGAQGAGQFLSAYDQDASTIAAPLFPKAAAANRPIFYDEQGNARSVGEIRDRLKAKLESGGEAVMPWPSATPDTSEIAAQRGWTRSETARPPLELRGFEPMPKHLSLQFARDAYQRLAALGGPST